MSRDGITAEMRERFAAAEKVQLGATPLAQPPLRPNAESLRAHFASAVGRAETPLENPHLEPRVGEEERRRALPAAVLIVVRQGEPAPTVILTRRPEGISYPGHWVFPGGRGDPGDATPIDTALREAREELGIAPEELEVLGRLGDYVSHSGYRIAPVVALAPATLALRPDPREVEAVAEVELARLLDSANYFLYRMPGREGRAHFSFDAGQDEIWLTGVTVSLAIGLYGQLLATHA